MSKNNYYTDAYVSSSLTNKIDITRIVKYVCIAAVLIVAIVFSSKTLKAINSLREEG